MAQSTTAINACDASLWLDDDDGTLQDISGSTSILDANFDNELGAYVTFQEKWPRRLECGQDATFTVTAVYTTTADEMKDLILTWYFGTRGDRSFTFYLPDKDFGSDYFKCEVKLENWRITPSRAEPGAIALTVVLRPSGAVTHSVTGT